MSGTSMAAPMITGALALCAAYAPEEDAYNRRNRLLASVRETSSLAGKCAAGGILDLSRLTVYQTRETYHTHRLGYFHRQFFRYGYFREKNCKSSEIKI